MTDEDFREWESDTFGYGYGTGEEHILPALSEFFKALPENESYDFRLLESKLGSVVAWLLINTLCHADIIEYGCSPRFGWLTLEGLVLKRYIDSKTPEDLYNIVCEDRP